MCQSALVKSLFWENVLIIVDESLHFRIYSIMNLQIFCTGLHTEGFHSVKERMEKENYD